LFYIEKLLMTYSDPPPGINLALGRPAYQTDDMYRRGATGPQKAVDGNHANTWREKSCTATGDKGNLETNWWAVKLNQEYEIKVVRLSNRGDCCGKSFKD
jgi:hypothetical protein